MVSYWVFSLLYGGLCVWLVLRSGQLGVSVYRQQYFFTGRQTVLQDIDILIATQERHVALSQEIIALSESRLASTGQKQQLTGQVLKQEFLLELPPPAGMGATKELNDAPWSNRDERQPENKLSLTPSQGAVVAVVDEEPANEAPNPSPPPYSPLDQPASIAPSSNLRSLAVPQLTSASPVGTGAPSKMNAGGTAAAAGALVSPLKNASSNVPAPSGADKVITAKLIDNEQNEYVLSKTKGGNALLVDHFLGGDLEVIALGCVLAVLFASLAGQHRANGFMLTGLVVGPGGLALLRQFVQLDAIARIGSLLLTYYIGSRMSRRTKLGHKDQRSFRSMVLRLIAVGFGRAVVLSLVFAAIFHWIMPWTHAQCAIVGSALAFSHCGTRFDFLTREHKLAKSMVAIEHYTMVGQNVYFVLVLLLHVVLKNTLSVGADLKERYADRQWASVGAISWCMLQTIVIVFGLVALCLMLRPSVKRMILESRFVHVNGLAVAFPFAFGSVLTGVLEVLIAQVVRVEYNTDILLLGAFLSGFVLSYGEWVLTHRPTERHIFGISALDIENGETGESSRWQSALTTSSKGQNGLSFGLAFEAIFYASLGMLIRVAALRDDARLIASLLLLGSGGKLLLGLASARLVGKAGSSAMGLAVRAAMPGEFTFLLLSHGLAAEELGKPVAQAAACVMFTSCVVYSTALSLSHK